MATRIAIIDDEKVVLALMHDALDDQGYELYTYSSPLDAIAQIPELSVDLIISDIRMPAMNGTELLSGLRDKGVSAPAIFMTGYASLDSAKEAIKLGASGYINKPFELAELRQAITTVLETSIIRKKSEQDDESRLQTLGQLLFDSSDQQAVIYSTLRFSLDHSRADIGSLVLIRGEQAIGLSLSKGSDSIDEEILEQNVAQLLVDRFGTIDAQPGQISDDLLVEMRNAIARSVDTGNAVTSWLTGNYMALSVPVSVEQASFGVILLGFADDSIRLRKADIALLALTGRQLAITLFNQELLRESKEAFARLNDAQDQMIGLERLAERGELSAEIGHELNNFLQVVRGNVEVINLRMRKQSYDQLPAAMTKITDAVISMTRFTSQLMGDYDGSEGRTELSLADLLREVVERVTIQRRYRGIVLDTRLLDTGSAIISADQMKLQQLFYNVLNNAADAMSNAPVRKLSIRMATDSNGQLATITIGDTGCGFAPEDLQRAFSERFTTKKHGHGFGLLVCKKIIESHDGTLDIQSTQGKGTTLTIHFPLVTANVLTTTLTEYQN